MDGPAKSLQSCPTLCDSIDGSPLGSTVPGILQARTLEWGARAFSVDGPRDYHTKQRKSERERQIPYDITYMWNLKYDTNELICETETYSQT